MRSPLCSDCGEICPEDQGIGSENESKCEIQGIEKPYEKCHNYKTAIFGICLDNLMGTTPRVAPQIPFILSRLCRYIEQHGLHYKHLFLEDEKDLVESLKLEFNESGDAPLESAGNVASVAKLLIVFFEELPEPLIPVSSQPDFIKDMERLSLNTGDYVAHLKQSLNKLPGPAYQILKYLSRFLFRIASHKEYNGMSSDNLSIIFGPVIFRLTSNDPEKLANVRSVVNNFVQNYHSIFEDRICSSCDDKLKQKSDAVMSETSLRRQIPCPSTVVPVMTLMPLSVVIPSNEAAITDDKKAKGNVPVLLIEGHPEGPQKVEARQIMSDVIKENNVINRKRKERRLSGEDSQPRSSSEERPAPVSITSVDKIDLMRRCSSNEEMKENTPSSDAKIEALMSQDISKKDLHNLDCFVSDSVDMVVNEKNHSPHPPNAKRREIALENLDYNFITHSWMDSTELVSPDSPVASDSSSASSELDNCNLNTEQNSIAEIEATNFMECDASENIETGQKFDSSMNSEDSDNQRSGIPRSSSCPVPNSDKSSEDESSSLSLSWSMLFESPDSEPLRSEHRYSWPLTKEVQEDTALLSPTVQSLRKSNFNEAPLSPSAFRSYLSHRSSHLDPSVPPSPPVEQEDFAKNLIESSAVSDSIKQFTKKIHCIKKRIRKFDEKFENEFGYKPSHAEKANHPEAKKLMNDLHKARKELKALKEESHLEQVSPASWHSSKSSHILGDSTNHVIKDLPKIKPSVQDTYGVAMKSLADERKLANRPDCVEDMTNDQVKDEKLAIQRALLDFENIHGKPCSKQERNTIRPLYDRYRSIKRLLVRSGSFPGAMSKSKDVCSELQPILEHETMDFTSPQHRTEVSIEIEEPKIPEPEVSSEVLKTTYSLDNSKNSNILALKYDNSNIHELPLSEMVFQLQQVKSQKRHLRKILREFESEFLRLNGRKVQKEDKEPVDTLYVEYKHVKARLKLLEALISKHDQHQLM